VRRGLGLTPHRKCNRSVVPAPRRPRSFRSLGLCASCRGGGRPPIPIDISPRTMGRDPSGVNLGLTRAGPRHARSAISVTCRCFRCAITVGSHDWPGRSGSRQGADAGRSCHLLARLISSPICRHRGHVSGPSATTTKDRVRPHNVRGFSPDQAPTMTACTPRLLGRRPCSSAGTGAAVMSRPVPRPRPGYSRLGRGPGDSAVQPRPFRPHPCTAGGERRTGPRSVRARARDWSRTSADQRPSCWTWIWVLAALRDAARRGSASGYLLVSPRSSGSRRYRWHSFFGTVAASPCTPTPRVSPRVGRRTPPAVSGAFVY
jgi:hypothetical protein